MTSNDEIYLSYLCQQILVACDRIHKKLDKYDEFLSSYTTPVIACHEQPSWHVATDVVQPRPPPDPPNGQPWNYVQPEYQHHSHHQPLTAAYGQPPYASFDSGVNNTCWPPAPVTCSLPQPTIAASVILHNPKPQVSMVPDQFQQQPPPSCWSPTNHHHHAVYCCEPPTDLHQHHTYGQEHHQHHQIQQLAQPGDASWQLHHQCQESVLNQQPPPQHFHSSWHPPSPHSETTPVAAISPCSPNFRYGSNELLAVDIEESVRYGEILYDDTAIDQLLIRDQIEGEVVLLDVEEVIGLLQGFEVANFEYVNEAEMAAEEEISAPPSEGKATNKRDCVSFVEDPLQDQYEVQEVEGFNVMGKGQRSPKQMVSRESCPKQENLLRVVGHDLIIWEHAIISHRPTSLDADARLIPPHDDTPSPHLLWELCNVGEQLDRILSTGGNYAEEDARVVIVQILKVVVHREFYLNSSLKAIDFGLSDYVKADERLNDVVGTFYYVAPEVLNRSHGTEADMWGIGVIAYILLYGSRASWGRTGSEIFQAVLIAYLSFEEDPWSNLSPDAIDFVKQLSNKDYGEVFVPPRGGNFVQGLLRYNTMDTQQRSWAFDPGGDTSSKLIFAMLFVVWWFPP